MGEEWIEGAGDMDPVFAITPGQFCVDGAAAPREFSANPVATVRFGARGLIASLDSRPRAEIQ